VGVSVEGTVHNEATVSPIFDEHYKNIMRNRTSNSSIPKRQTIKLTPEEEKEARRLQSINNGDSFSWVKIRKKFIFRNIFNFYIYY